MGDTQLISRGVTVYVIDMRISRYLDAKSFLDEAKALKVMRSHITDAVLERLEGQRSLIPRLRLHYPDPIERRWWAEGHESYEVGGEIEPDGSRWEDAKALEAARQKRRWAVDPTVTPHPLDNPETRFRRFMEKPEELPAVPWRDYRVSVNADGDKPFYTSQTVVTYYSSWQLLQYAEVVTMGVTALMCQPARDLDPRSASKIDPAARRDRAGVKTTPGMGV